MRYVTPQLIEYGTPNIDRSGGGGGIRYTFWLKACRAATVFFSTLPASALAAWEDGTVSRGAVGRDTLDPELLYVHRDTVDPGLL